MVEWTYMVLESFTLSGLNSLRRDSSWIAHVEIRPGPRIGEDTNEVMREVCKFSEAEIAELTEAGILA